MNSPEKSVGKSKGLFKSNKRELGDSHNSSRSDFNILTNSSISENINI